MFIQLFFILGLTLETYLSPHYFAPIIALNYYFIIQGIRIWRARNHRVGQFVLYAVPLLALAVLAIVVYQSNQAYDAFAPYIQRARLLGQLKQQPGMHLIVVKYGPNHSFHKEWVYNEADIDASKVVWARDMEMPQNCELINYFKDRVIWSLEIDRDEDPVKLRPYPKESCLSANAGT